jgi:hypothetical protein
MRLDELGQVHYCEQKLENRVVTPHVPALLEPLGCHIYADVRLAAMIFLYIFKYPFKGLDWAKSSLHSLRSSIGEECDTLKTRR